MSDDDTVETTIDAEAVAAADTDAAEDAAAADTEAVDTEAVDDEPINDTDGDGKVSILEAERARLGLVDARLEEIAHHGGVTGHIAEAAHKLLDKFDND